MAGKNPIARGAADKKIIQQLRARVGSGDPLQAKVIIEVAGVTYSRHILDVEALEELRALSGAIAEWIGQLEVQR